MAKLLYSIKITLLENAIDQLPLGTVTTKHQKEKLKEFVMFITLIYSKWWLTSASATDAPWNDLCLYKNLIKFAKINKKISVSAIKAFDRHLWYLTGEIIPLALFSCILPDTEKAKLAAKMLKEKPVANQTEFSLSLHMVLALANQIFPRSSA